MATKIHKGIRPIRILPIGFGVVILLGTLLLTLPFATRNGMGLSPLDALFTATSATCVTGLVVVDTGTYFTRFGQSVILVLIQIGGLGFMTLATILFGFTRRRISLRERLTLAESLGEDRLQGIVHLGRAAVAVTFSIEAIGAILLAIRFIPQFGVGEGIWNAVFHSVSAFCNAGFDLIGGYRSLTGYVGDWYVNGIIMLLIVLGGLGFAVLLGVTKRRISLQMRLVLIGTVFMIIIIAVATLFLEQNNPDTLGSLPFAQKLLATTFQSVTFRTAGFNTIDTFALRDSTKLIGVFTMLVGGAPAGTAGGLKITTLMVLALSVRAHLKGRHEVHLFSRRIPWETTMRSLCIVVIGVTLLLVGTMLISMLEEGTAAGGLGFINQLFEAASALCTVGLSTGVTAAAGPGSRLILCLLMFTGRIGLLTFGLSLTGHRSEALIRYPTEDVMVG